MRVNEAQSAIRSRGSEGFAQLVESLVRKDSNGKRKMEPGEFSIKAMHDAFVQEKGGVLLDGDLIERIAESISSTAFAKATGALINQMVIDGYGIQGLIGDQLVTTIPSRLKTETIVGINALDTPEIVPEGSPYPDSSTAEKYVTIPNVKRGRIITLTEETILFDQTGQILNRAFRLGEKTALEREKLIVRACVELDSNIYRPSGSAATLYDNSTNSNLAASSGFGTSALNTVVNKLREFTDENSDPIIVPFPWQLLVPSELMPNAESMFGAEHDPDTAENELNVHRGKYQPLTSPFLTSSTDWWLGNFKRQFVYTEIWPIQTMSRPAGTDADFEKDIRYAHKVRMYGGVGAVDTKYVVEANA